MKLNPGDKLRWREPDIDEEWLLPHYHRWREKHGEEVEFVSYATKGEPLVLHSADHEDLPILNVRTKAGIVVFSAGYFVC